MTFISTLFGDWWDFVKSGYMQYYLPLVQLNLLRLGATIVVGLVFVIIYVAAVLAAVAGGSVAGMPLAALAVMAAIFIAAAVALQYVAQCFENSAYMLTAGYVEGKPFGIIGILNSLKGVTLRFTLLDLLLRALLMVPAVAVIAAAAWLMLSNASTLPSGTLLLGGLGLYMLLYFYFFGANALFDYFSQFWRYGFLLEGKGLMESLKRGFRLLRSNFFETLVSDAIIGVLSLVAYLPVMAFMVVAYLALVFVQLLVMLVPLLGIVIYVLAVLVVAIASIILSTIMEVVWRPAHYMLWRKLAPRG